MKNFTKKHGFFAVSAVLLLVTAMLVTTWCSNDISNDEYTPPPGKGAVRLSFNNEIARTILPDNATLASFGEFDFAFTATGGGAITYTEEGIIPSKLTDPIALDPGTYTLKVIAYIDIADHSVPMTPANMQPAATNNPAVPVTITAAKTTSAIIVLKPYDQTVGTGNGTFRYEIISSIAVSDLTSADMKLTPIIAGSAELEDITSVWNDGDSHDLTVKAGDYYLDFVIEVKTGETVTFRHIVHIYQNMTSSYEFTINPDYFNAVFKLIAGNLTYVHPENNLPELSYNDGTSDIPLTEGATVEVEQGETVTITVTNDGDFDSFEWYSQDDTCLGTDEFFEVDATDTGDFHAKKTYLLTVVGVKDSIKYYTFINIKVVAAP